MVDVQVGIDSREAVEAGNHFIDAVVAQDWAALAALFAPDAVFRAVVPSEERPFREKVGGSESADQLRAWFGDADQVEVLDREVERVVDRVKIRYRIRGHESTGWFVVEQLAFASLANGRFERMNLTCSGFRPVD